MNSIIESMFAGFMLTGSQTKSEPVSPHQILQNLQTKVKQNKLSKLTYEQMLKREQELLKQHNQYLIDHDISMSRRQLKAKDQIDVRPLLSLNPNDPLGIPSICPPANRESYIDTYGWYACIPCLSEAVIRLNKNRYLYYKMTDLKPEENKYSIYLHDYMIQDYGIATGVYGTAEFSFEYEDSHDLLCSRRDDVMLFTDIYAMVPYQDLHWSKLDIQIWKESAIRYAEELQKYLHDHYSTDNFGELCKIFVSITTLINQQLYEQKISRPIRQKNSLHQNRTIAAPSSADTPPKQSVRMVGAMSIRSEKPPKPPTEETIIHYKVASWKTRGFLRTLKSGKQVWVKESVHKRHCLNQDVVNPTQTVMKFRTGKDES